MGRGFIPREKGMTKRIRRIRRGRSLVYSWIPSRRWLKIIKTIITSRRVVILKGRGVGFITRPKSTRRCNRLNWKKKIIIIRRVVKSSRLCAKEL